jgi:hypothetical protein
MGAGWAGTLLSWRWEGSVWRAEVSRARVAERITRWADVRCALESGRIADIGGCRRVNPKRSFQAFTRLAYRP